MNDFVLIAGVVAGLLLYFLPALIGGGRRNATAIFWLNLLLGWSVIGWVVALVWALTKEAEPAQAIVQSSGVSLPPAPALPVDRQARVNRLRDLRDRGYLTSEQFFEEINRI